MNYLCIFLCASCAFSSLPPLSAFATVPALQAPETSHQRLPLPTSSSEPHDAQLGGGLSFAASREPWLDWAPHQCPLSHSSARTCRGEDRSKQSIPWGRKGEERGRGRDVEHLWGRERRKRQCPRRVEGSQKPWWTSLLKSYDPQEKSTQGRGTKKFTNSCCGRSN